MAIFRWNAEKNEILARERGITFEEIVRRLNPVLKLLKRIIPTKRNTQTKKS
jgi:uncharacterized DUF497 family protein